MYCNTFSMEVDDYDDMVTCALVRLGNGNGFNLSLVSVSHLLLISSFLKNPYI